MSLSKKHKRRLFGKRSKSRPSGDMALQITSMADVFVILLVFLLKGIASDALQIAPSNGTRLPAGVNTRNLTDRVLQIEVAKEGILIEKELIMPLENFRSPASAKIKDGLLPELNGRLQKERERQKLISEANDSVKNDGQVIILSDQEVPFYTLKPILRTLAANGYSDIKFAVIKAD